VAERVAASLAPPRFELSRTCGTHTAEAERVRVLGLEQARLAAAAAAARRCEL
jgi:hypothetical protein